MSRPSNWATAVSARAKRFRVSAIPCVDDDHVHGETLRDAPGSPQRWIGHLFPLDPTASAIRSDADEPTVLCP